MEAVANLAQLAALRYQLNPHFLFNTLNSIASLIASGATDTAERMVENLADFLRATLELDPHDDISLAREIELQQMYLSIEQQRFPNRLISEIDIPPELLAARVPALITQPLVENSIRHAVARSVDPVTLRLGAIARGKMLVLFIEDDGRPQRKATKGTGLGIANVRARLRGRFGAAQAITVSRPNAGGFQVELRMPLVTTI
jgi:LytS/YehU family sensor histidine kinase